MNRLNSSLVVIALTACLGAAQPSPQPLIRLEALGPHPGRITQQAISRDGRHLAIVVLRGNKFVVLVDGKQVAECSDLDKDGMYFSRDGKRFAFVAFEGSKYSVVVDGRAGAEYDEIFASSPMFSPDSKRVAYAAKRGQKVVVVVDGREGRPYDDDIHDPIFSADGKRS